MKPDITEVVDKVDKLPELNAVVLQVAKMLDNPDIKINDLSKVISSDASLTSQLLKLCNSAHYGFSRKVSSVNDAISKLGFKTLKNLIFVAISHGLLKTDLKGYDLEEGQLWSNAISCAVYCKYLASTSNYQDPDLAFTAGLLRDIGKIIIHEYVKEGYDDIINLINSNNISFSSAECQILGFDHCQIGSKIATKWNFPEKLIETIEHHHSPDQAFRANCSDLKLVSIVHICDSITMMLGTGIGSDGMMYHLELKSFENLDIPQQSKSLEGLISNMVELNSEIEALVGFINGNK